MAKKPTYKELEQRVKELEKESIHRREAEEALQRAQKELQTIVDSVPALIAYKDSNNRYIRINKTYAEAINLPRDHIEGKSAFDIASNREFAEAYWRDDKEVMASGTPKRNIIEPLLFDETRTGQADKIPYRDDKGNIIGVILFCIDITSRVRAEEALRESEERYRAAIENSNDGISIVKDYKCIYVNKKLAQMLGYDQSELPGKPITFGVHPDDQDFLAARMQKRQRGDKVPSQYEISLMRENGQVIAVEVSTTRITYKGEQVCLGFMRDISDRKRAEEQLRAAEQEKAAVLNSMSQLLIFQDPDNRVMWTNRAAAEPVGLSPEQLKGRYCYEIWHQRDKACQGCPVVKARETGQPRENEMATPDGRAWLVRGYPVKDATGNVVGMVEATLEITERKQAEEALRECHETLLAVLNSIDADVYASDLKNYQVLFINKHMQESFGEDLVGRHCYEVFRGEREPCAHCTNDKLLDANGEPVGVIVWEGQNPVTKRWYRNYDKAISWRDGGFVRLQVATDITTLKQAEEEKDRLQAQLLQAQKVEAIGPLAGGIAHSSNNLLMGVMGNTSLMLSETDSAHPNYERLKNIEKSV